MLDKQAKLLEDFQLVLNRQGTPGAGSRWANQRPSGGPWPPQSSAPTPSAAPYRPYPARTTGNKPQKCDNKGNVCQYPVYEIRQTQDPTSTNFGRKYEACKSCNAWIRWMS